MRPRSRSSLAALALTAALAGCGGSEAARGTLAALPIKLGALGPRPSATLAVAPPRDRRPAVEHAGESIGTAFFFTVGVVTHWERRGSYVTDDEAVSPTALAELAEAATSALSAANVARVVAPSAPSDFLLEVDVEHLYGTHYAVTDGTVVVVSMQGNRGGFTGAGVGTSGRQYASYGNVGLAARLLDRRSGQPLVVWSEHVAGTGVEPPQPQHQRAAQTALRMALADAMATLSVRVGAALDRLEVGPNGPAFVVAAEGPPVFLAERVSQLRDFVERVYVETRTGVVLRHEVVPNADHAYARPGDWLLSRRTPEGVVLSPEGYEAWARALAARYDLRRVDDAARYHFFGVRGAAPPPTR